MDSLTQLQDWLDFLAERFFTSVGVLQRDAGVVTDQQPNPALQETVKQFSKEIIHASRVCDAIIAQVCACCWLAIYGAVTEIKTNIRGAPSEACSTGSSK